MLIQGVDHVDFRVPSLALVQPFYDALLPSLGLSRKTFAHVGDDGEWYGVDATHPCNTVEYHTPVVAGEKGWFVGFIEDRDAMVGRTRTAFSLDRESELHAIETLLRAAGARRIEWSIDPAYPAVFFEDPVGTRLEICARRPRG